MASKLKPGLQRTASDDAELLDRIRQGAPDDFGEIVRRHQSRVFSILHRYERDYHRVEDLAQETFVKAWRALARFDGRVPFEHWLSRIAVRVALDHLRRQRRARNEVGLPDLGEDALEWLRAGEDRSELNARQARDLLDVALRELAPAERQVIILQEIEGYSVNEICRLTGWTKVATRVRAYRARKRLRRELERLERSGK